MRPWTRAPDPWSSGTRSLLRSGKRRRAIATWLAHVSPRTAVPTNALIVACVVPLLIAVLVFFNAGLLYQVTAFAVFGR